MNTYLEGPVKQNPHKIALITKEGQFSYEWLNTMANHFASNLIARCNVNPGDRIALMLANSVHFVIAYFGILKTGSTVVPIHALLKSKEISYILNHSEARILITESEHLPEVHELAKGESSLEHCLVRRAEPNSGFFRLEEFYEEPVSPLFDMRSFRQNGHELAVMFYTSGTTGRPKGVMITHDNIYYKMNPLKQAMNCTSEDRILCGLPMVYVYGQIMALHLAVWCNGTLILLEEESVPEIVEALEKHHPTMMLSIPTIYYRLNCLDAQMKRHLFRSLRYAITGGANIPGPLKEEFEKSTGIQLLDSYGLTETTACVIMERPGEVRKPGSIGFPIPDNEIRIFDEMGMELPPGQIGEIAVSARYVMKGYFKDDMRQYTSVKQGWLFTGDMGYQDVDGYFFLVDRRKDIIQSAGFVISPREVEEVLLRHPFITDTAVVGIPDVERGEIVKAYVVLKPGVHLEEDELHAYTREHLARFKCPSVFEIVEELPRNQSGKLLKRLLK